MKKTIKIEVEVTLAEGVEQQVVEVAREHYREAGQARVPLDDKADRWREVPAEEFIPDAETAIMELIGTNDLLEKAGAEVTSVSGLELQREELRGEETHEAALQDAASLGGEVRGGSDVDLDEFETGVYLCRWPNGDFSLVTANTRREALVQLDEWAGAYSSQLFPIDSCMVDFGLNDQGKIELKQFGEETEELIWEISYPDLQAVLANVMRQDGGEHTPEAKESICKAVQHERVRLCKNQPEYPQAETELGRTLQKRLRTSGPVADHYVQEMAHDILVSMDNKGGKPN